MDQRSQGLPHRAAADPEARHQLNLGRDAGADRPLARGDERLYLRRDLGRERRAAHRGLQFCHWLTTPIRSFNGCRAWLEPTAAVTATQSPMANIAADWAGICQSDGVDAGLPSTHVGPA
jgi:hypothetical protein